MKKITPFLWFDMNAEEAMRYYIEVFPDSHVNKIERYPDASLSEHFVGMRGKVINGEFTLNGHDFACLDGGPQFTFNESISFMVECADQAEIDYYWSKLSHNSANEQCGWCKDKFGVSWQIVPYNMSELIQTPAQIQAMMQMKKLVISELEQAGSSPEAS